MFSPLFFFPAREEFERFEVRAGESLGLCPRSVSSAIAIVPTRN
jgi:hypothetical protein